MLFLLLACAHHPGRPTVEAVTLGAAPALGTLRAEGVALASVVVVNALPAPPLPPQAPPGRIEAGLDDPALPPPTVLDPVADAAFLRGEYVGNVRFGGGVIASGEVALQSRARLMEFNEQARYTEQGRAWLRESLEVALTGLGVPVRPGPELTPPVERVPTRGMHELDGRDNVNLPRGAVRPVPMAAAPDATGWVLVPLLRTYYTHNGGWFIGQQYGTMAGARVEVVVALYDARSGAPVWWMDALGRHVDPSTATPSTAQLDQYLLWAEDDVEAALDRELLR